MDENKHCSLILIWHTNVSVVDLCLGGANSSIDLYLVEASTGIDDFIKRQKPKTHHEHVKQNNLKEINNCR